MPEHVLLVEDDIVDILHIKYGFRENNIASTVDVAKSGIEALEMITTDKSYEVPKVIILDINMPKMNGFDFLRKLRQNDNYRKVPTIVVTTSDSPTDKKTAEELDVAGYFVKPLNFDQFIPLYQKIIND